MGTNCDGSSCQDIKSMPQASSHSPEPPTLNRNDNLRFTLLCQKRFEPSSKQHLCSLRHSFSPIHLNVRAEPVILSNLFDLTFIGKTNDSDSEVGLHSFYHPHIFYSFKMCDVENALPIAARRDLRISLAENPDPYILAIPKVELHVHIEGTLTPELKWRFSQRNGQILRHPRTGAVFSTLEELQDSHDTMKPRNGERMDNIEETLSFFEAYYGGFEVLKTKQDYYDLAMNYFEHAAAMRVRYCEIFFDPQGHTRLGVSWSTMMTGFRKAQKKAEMELNVSKAIRDR